MARHALKPRKKPRKRRTKSADVAFIEPNLRGRERLTLERFFSGVGDAFMVDQLKATLHAGYQLTTKSLDYQLVPAVVILACYGRHYEGIELVDDYEDLLRAHLEATTEGGLCAHPDLFMASCICILEKREQFPCQAAFEDINVPTLFNQLVVVEET
jgi:hypothetical protein